MRRFVVLALAGAMAVPAVAVAQSPAPSLPLGGVLTLCVTARVENGVPLEPVEFQQAVVEGRVLISEVGFCDEPLATTSPPTLSAPSPTPAPDPTERPTATRKPAFESLDKRAWQRIVRSPDDHVGERVKIWGCISQFDQNTGPDTFRAETYYKKLGEYDWYGDTTNSFLSGDIGDLEDFGSDDVFSANATIVGAYEYETTIGGNASAVLFLVDSIRRRGSC